MSTSNYCDPTVDIDQGADCELPDPRILDLRKGNNPQFLAYQTNRVRFQRVAQLNNEIQGCNEDLNNCAFAPKANKIEQMLSRQQSYEQDEEGKWVPKNPIAVNRRSAADFPGSTHQGRVMADEQNHELYRKVQRDDRQCIQFDSRCGMLDTQGNPDSKVPGALLSTLYSGSAWTKPGALPSWAAENRTERQIRGDAGDDNSTLGYEDRF